MKNKRGKQKKVQAETKTAGIRPEKKAASFSPITGTDLLPFIFICLYAIVELIPGTNTADVLGNQWLYLALINIAAVLFIALGKRQILPANIYSTFRNLQTLLYAAFLIIAGFSFLAAINKTESLVCYARLINTFIMYFNLALLLYGGLHLLRPLAALLSLLLLWQSVQVLIQFFRGMETTNINAVIYNLKLNAGNKNILAASLAIKVPFVIYCALSSRSWGRFLFPAILYPLRWPFLY